MVSLPSETNLIIWWQIFPFIFGQFETVAATCSIERKFRDASRIKNFKICWCLMWSFKIARHPKKLCLVKGPGETRWKCINGIGHCSIVQRWKGKFASAPLLTSSYYKVCFRGQWYHEVPLQFHLFQGYLGIPQISFLWNNRQPQFLLYCRPCLTPGCNSL